MKLALAIMTLILGLFGLVSNGQAADTWKSGDIVGTVLVVSNNGVLLNNLYIQLPAAPVKAGDAYYECGANKFKRTTESIFVYASTNELKVKDVVLGAVRYKDTRATDRNGKSAVRAFALIGVLSKQNPDEAIQGPIVQGAGGGVEPKKGSLSDRIRQQRNSEGQTGR